MEADDLDDSILQLDPAKVTAKISMRDSFEIDDACKADLADSPYFCGSVLLNASCSPSW